jgi:hypothetical protein
VRWALGKSSAPKYAAGGDLSPHPLIDAELFLRFGTEALRRPRRSPNYVHSSIPDAGQLFQARFHLHADIHMLGTALSRQGHLDGNVLLVFFDSLEVDLVDQGFVYTESMSSGKVPA